MDFEIYQGKSTPLAETSLGLGPNAVLRLVRTLPEKSSIFFDRYFTTIPLLDELLKKGIDGTGTIMANRVRSVRFRGDAEMKQGDLDELTQNDEVAIVKWKDSRTVLLASTCAGATNVQPVKRWSKKEKYIDVPAPEVVRRYNASMGALGGVFEAAAIRHSVQSVDSAVASATSLPLASVLANAYGAVVNTRLPRAASPAASTAAGPAQLTLPPVLAGRRNVEWPPCWPPQPRRFVTVVNKAAQCREKALAAADIAADPAVVGTVLYCPLSPGGTFKGSPRLTLAAAFATRPGVVAVRINHRRNILAADTSAQPCLSELLTKRSSTAFPSLLGCLRIGARASVRAPRRRRAHGHGAVRGHFIQGPGGCGNQAGTSLFAGFSCEYGTPDRVQSSAGNAGTSGTSPRHASVPATAVCGVPHMRPTTSDRRHLPSSCQLRRETCSRRPHLSSLAGGEESGHIHGRRSNTALEKGGQSCSTRGVPQENSARDCAHVVRLEEEASEQDGAIESALDSIIITLGSDASSCSDSSLRRKAAVILATSDDYVTRRQALERAGNVVNSNRQGSAVVDKARSFHDALTAGHAANTAASTASDECAGCRHQGCSVGRTCCGHSCSAPLYPGRLTGSCDVRRGSGLTLQTGAPLRG
ncbi:hypothetical protein HPB52_005793 [Rhipicephalus sanguineus]|uniref:PiggyBac transposable element-derived protein domain-containing protein n=1 Tax=Rhipicephalus sanguineus TaxID=34632 RepID=A0A9D4PVT3_RHISA|nr:hypothetical protein HPB52_005793 [Rhipicephalus sanguineus]